MSSDLNKFEFTDIGELQKTDDGGLIVVLPFGKALRRVMKHLIGVKLELTFKPLKYQRSNAQNRWLWGVAYVMIAAHLNETEGRRPDRNEVHAHTLRYILGYALEAGMVDGKEVLYVKGKSTSQLTTTEFNEMKENLQAYWAERGLDIPDPKDGRNNYLSDYLDDE